MESVSIDPAPLGWERVQIGEITSIVGGGTPDTKRPELFGVGTPWITPADLTGYTGKWISTGSRSLTPLGVSRSGAKPMPPGTVLLSSRAPIGHIAIAKVELATSQGFKSFLPTPALDPEYLYYWLTFRKDAIKAMGSGTTFSEISGKVAATIPVLVAPRELQPRIVSAIEEEFARLDAAVRSLEAAKKKLAAFRASVLQAAVEGRLVPTEAELSRRHTEETGEDRPFETGAELLDRILKERREKWEAEQVKKFEMDLRKKLGEKPPEARKNMLYDFEDAHGAELALKVAQFECDPKWKAKYKQPTPPDTSKLPSLPEGWAWATTEQLVAFDKYSLSIGPFGSNLKVPDYRESGVPLVFVRHIRSEVFSFAGDPFVDPDKAEELIAHQVDPGDLLITKMGDPPGDVALYPVDRPKAVITADCIRFKVNPRLNRAYIRTALRSVVVQRQIQGITTGVAQQKVSLEKFRQVSVPLPSRVEQDSIAMEAESHKEQEGTLSAEISKVDKFAELLRQAILKAAFEGKLVPQNPNHEPAEILLQKVRLNSSPDTAKPPSRRKSMNVHE